MTVKELDQVVVRFSGDSGDGMQLAGNIFSTVSATVGNSISTFPDYPADIRAPQGSLTGVSGFQVHIGAGKVYTPGDLCDVLVAMNAAALKTQLKYAKKDATIIIDTDAFKKNDLEKAAFATDDPLAELGVDPDRVIACPISQMVKDALADTGMDAKSVLKCRNMFALGLVCWLFSRDLEIAFNYLRDKFAKKPGLADANIKVIQAGYDYGHNIHASVSTYRIETEEQRPGIYTDVNGNKATAWGLIMASEKSGRPLFLGSYPITPATDILHELAKRRDLGVKAVQMEDEIGGICATVGASFAGNLAVTSTSGPGLSLKSEALGLAVMAELPLVLIDVQRGGPSTGLPTKTEQTDLQQALYGRSGECPLVVLAALSPTDCFHMAFEAARIAIEHMTPVVLLTDAFIANGSSAWRIPEAMYHCRHVLLLGRVMSGKGGEILLDSCRRVLEDEYPEIKPNYVPDALKAVWKPYMRDARGVRYWAIPGTPGLEHLVGGLEKDYNSGIISNDPINHAHMVETRRRKVENVAQDIPELQLRGDRDADTIIVGWGGTYGHILDAVREVRSQGKKLAMAQFRYINPLPKNTADVLNRFKTVIVAELNDGQFASYLQSKMPALNICHINKVQGQPFMVQEIVNEINKVMEDE